ncbi:alpha/beta hydrolase family protein [Oryzicola mucosus]|uniref:Prolyl oligopeptidase family serine peptidase n=1 Tax=Oryzicola mucosus TaxID=2767425 RepID=A0A8J6PLP8_9HYPH|nr:prolyl oligopeptidase family serine peptidase [Oryzicola mucosus]MBD0415881.1 prolyl oligopeptidase family serine peptidase [Oryzicola mucosus]
MSNIVRTVALCCGVLYGALPAAMAEESNPVQVSSGITYEFLARWDVDRLNQILTAEMPKFSGFDVKYTPARNAVKLYRVTYNSVVPEKGNKPIVASGLLAIPDTDGKSFPIVSYQHGTVYGRQEVPSFADQSPETQAMIAQFAGQGYMVIGADYFGMGISTEPEGYLVKGSHQQACVDMITSTNSVLEQMKISSDRLFLAGWSQGGYVTMACLEKLESAGVKVNAAATASAPLDLFALMNGFFNFPRKNDAEWLNSIVILTAFSFENYYGLPGLARSVLNDDVYEVARKAYVREPFDAATIPSDLHKLVRAEYFDTQFFAASAYGRLMLTNTAYRWVVKSPVRNYYGEADEAITVGVGKIAMSYQQAMGAGNPTVEAVSTGQTTHRGTFATAVPEWKAWFDEK